jgi:hypothetical protein
MKERTRLIQRSRSKGGTYTGKQNWLRFSTNFEKIRKASGTVKKSYMRQGFLFYVDEGVVGRLFHGIIIIKGSLIGGRGWTFNGGRLEKSPV